MSRNFDIWLFVSRQHNTVRVVHDVPSARQFHCSLRLVTIFIDSLFLLDLSNLVASLSTYLLIKLLHLNMIDELWYSLLNQAALEETV